MSNKPIDQYLGALATLKAIATHLNLCRDDDAPKAYVFDTEPPANPMHTNTWAVRLETGGDEVSISYHVLMAHGDLEVVKATSLREAGADVVNESLIYIPHSAEASPHIRNSQIVHTILGHPAIPPVSRSATRDAEESGRRIALAEFRAGAFATPEGPLDIEVFHGDGSAVWETITKAYHSHATGRTHLHYATERRHNVPMVVIDIFDETYHNTAYELVEPFVSRANALIGQEN